MGHKHYLDTFCVSAKWGRGHVRILAGRWNLLTAFFESNIRATRLGGWFALNGYSNLWFWKTFGIKLHIDGFSRNWKILETFGMSC